MSGEKSASRDRVMMDGIVLQSRTFNELYVAKVEMLRREVFAGQDELTVDTD